MYSNNVPYREGALLYKDSIKANQIAKVYQRYKKFDQSSYSISNATFFNIFACESMRLGRYKIPISDNLLLCVTDPLTFSEMRRYFNSFNALKWFKSKFFQIKRKRQVEIPILPDSEDFLDYIVQFVEYGRIVEKVGERPVTIPVVPPRDLRIPPDLTFDTSVANSQYFLESIFQVILDYISDHQALGKCSILIGGDGRSLNAFARNTFIRVASGNGVMLVQQSLQNILTPSAARQFLIDNPSTRCAVVFTAASNGGGVRGKFGIQVIFPKTSTMTTCGLTSALTEKLPNLSHAKILPKKLLQSEVSRKISSLGSTQLQWTDPLDGYVSDLLRFYDVEGIRNYLRSNDISLVVNANHGSAGPLLLALFEKMKLDSSEYIINGDIKEDFGGVLPTLEISDSTTMMELFNPLIVDTVAMKLAIQQVVTQRDANPVQSIVRFTNADDSPDLGFAFNADCSKCMVVGAGLIVSPEETIGVIDTGSSSNDGKTSLFQVYNV